MGQCQFFIFEETCVNRGVESLTFKSPCVEAPAIRIGWDVGETRGGLLPDLEPDQPDCPRVPAAYRSHCPSCSDDEQCRSVLKSIYAPFVHTCIVEVSSVHIDILSAIVHALVGVVGTAVGQTNHQSLRQGGALSELNAHLETLA